MVVANLSRSQPRKFRNPKSKRGKPYAAAAVKSAPRAPVAMPQRTAPPEVSVDQAAYNNDFVHAFLSDNPADIPVKAAAADRRASSYFAITHSATKTFSIPRDQCCVVAYTPLTVAGPAGAEAYTPLPISSNTMLANTLVSAFTPLIAHNDITATPATLSSILPVQTNAASGLAFALLKGAMWIETSTGLSIDLPPLIRACGLANLDVEPAFQGAPSAVAATNWHDATLNSVVCPFLSGVDPTTVSVENHASSIVLNQAARTAFINGHPPIEQRKGTSFYPGTTKAFADGLDASSLLGYGVLGGSAAPHVVILNRGTTDLHVTVYTKGVYAMPMTYIDAKNLGAYCHNEASEVCLEDTVACSLSLGGVGTDVVDSAVAAKEAYICALQRCRTRVKEHIPAALATRALAQDAGRRPPSTFVRGRVADNGGTLHPAATPANSSWRGHAAQAFLRAANWLKQQTANMQELDPNLLTRAADMAIRLTTGAVSGAYAARTQRALAMTGPAPIA